MSPARRAVERAALLAAFAAGFAIAGQVAGKAARDSIFLDQYDVTQLPALVILSALLSIGAAVGLARAMARRSPARLVPLANLASAVLFVAEWSLFAQFPRPTAIAIYLHQSVLGTLLVSGLWSVVSESFDPRSARRAMGTIAAGATLGGVVGALLAERAAALLGTIAILPLLAVLQVVAGWRIWVLARSVVGPARSAVAPLALADAMRSLRRMALLRHLASMVVIGTVVAALLDYVFKARASQVLAGADLARFFAVFYGGVGVLAAAMQLTLGRVSLESWGIARTLAALPAAVTAFGAVAAAVPGLATVVAARGVDNVLRNSLHRQAYEILYTPLPAREKRATKTLVDVALERLGDALGGGLVAAVLLAGTAASSILLTSAVALSGVWLWTTMRVRKSYVEALEHSLKTRAIELDLDEIQDQTSRATLLHSQQRSSASRPEPPASRTGDPHDPLIARTIALRSGDTARVRAALDADLVPPLVPHAIPLLARDEVARAATLALQRVAGRSVGQLIDSLLDPREEFAVRRRLPRIIETAPGARAVPGLMAGLRDARLDVRLRCARSLSRVHEREPALAIDREEVFAAILREFEVNEPRKQVQFRDGGEEPEAEPGALVDELLRERASRDLELVFTLLTLALPAEPIRIAFRALHTDDPSLQGTALEYLEHALPPAIRDRLAARVQVPAGHRDGVRPREALESELVRSVAAIDVNLLHLSGERRVPER